MEPFESQRLTLRPFQSDDLEAAHSWFGDPAVMRYTPSGPDNSLDMTRARLESYSVHQSKYGFSKWIVVERKSARPIGDAGLMILDDPCWIDLGFRFAQPCWGRGFATEVGAAWVTAAFKTLGLDRLDAFVHLENGASIRVLEKLGFRQGQTRIVLGMRSICFSLKRRAAG